MVIILQHFEMTVFHPHVMQREESMQLVCKNKSIVDHQFVLFSVLLMLFSSLGGMQFLTSGQAIGDEVDAELEETDEIFMTNGSGNPYIATNVPYANSNPFRIGSWGYIYSYDLVGGDTYKTEWELLDSNGVQVDSGSTIWTQNATSSTYPQSESWLNLSVGDYCLEATLNDYFMGFGTNISYDSSCFTVVYSGDLSALLNNDYEYGDVIDVNISGNNLVTNVSFLVKWNLSLGNTVVDGGSTSWFTLGLPGNYIQDYYKFTLSGLTVGYHCFNTRLIVQNSEIDNFQKCFDVNNPVIPTGNLSLSQIGSDDSSEFSLGDSIVIYVEAENLSNENYNLDWRVIDAGGVDVENGSEFIDYWYHPVWDADIYLDLGEGDYCFEAILTLDLDDGDFNDTTDTCFSVTAYGDITIELTIEELVEIWEGECSDSSYLIQDDCESAGHFWNEWSNWEWQTQTEYQIGDHIVWDIFVENTSYTDYLLTWTMTDGGGTVLASNSLNHSDYGQGYSSYEVDDSGSCDLTDFNDYDCLWWYDYGVDFDAGTYCLQVELELLEGGDFYSSDEVCLEVYEVVVDNGTSEGNETETGGEGENETGESPPSNETDSGNETKSKWPDADGDGVIDELDECPETEKDAYTDRKGCAPSLEDAREGGYTPGFTTGIIVISLLSAAMVLRRRERILQNN